MNRQIASLGAVLLIAAACSQGPPTVSATDVDRFVVIGDFGAGHPGQYEVAASLEALAGGAGFDALVTIGDNFYTDDIDAIWLQPYGWLAEGDIPIYAAWGNHDIETEHRVELVEEHLAPPFWWYSVVMDGATLIVLDSNQVESPEQLDWLDKTLASTEGLVVVSFHHPAYSCGEHGSTEEVIGRWVPLFEQHGVDLVLSGHEHSYERTIAGDVVYVVAGGGGMPLRAMATCPVGTPPSITTNDTDHHYLLLEIGDGEISVSAIAPDGSVIDETVIADR